MTDKPKTLTEQMKTHSDSMVDLIKTHSDQLVDVMKKECEQLAQFESQCRNQRLRLEAKIAEILTEGKKAKG